MNEPKIGIVVPVYKVKEQFLCECVTSLTEQSYKNIQIILVDDCSPDDCGKLCEKFSEQDKRIKVIHHEINCGLPVARNTGINVLDKDCDWITFVDSDDWLDLDACKKFVEYLNKWNENPDFVIFSGYKNYPQKEMISAPAFDNETWFRGKESICELQQMSLQFVQKYFPANSINLDSACWRFLSLEFLKKNDIKFIDVPYREDGLFFLYTTEYAQKIVYIYEPFYHYRSTENSMVNMYRINADKEHALYLDEIWKFVKAFNKDSNFVNSVYYAVLLSMEICIEQKFYNKENKDLIFSKHRSCKEYFNREPFVQVFKKIELKRLRRNHWIKAILIKLRLYSGVVILKNFYNQINKKQNYS